jgi:hypothetical protein
VPHRQVVRGRRHVDVARELRGVHRGVVLRARKHGGLDEPVRGGLRVRVAHDGEHAAGAMPRGPLLPRRVLGRPAVPLQLLLAWRPDVHGAR